MIFLVFLGCYLVGSIPFGLILSRYILKVDIRSIGSGNIGATNVLRTGNKTLAALTLACDGFKGTLSVILLKLLSFDSHVIIMGAMLCVLGHIFPLWLRFKGGKGVATALGTLLGIHYGLFLCVALTWLTVAKIFRISSLAALVAFLLSPFYAYLFCEKGVVYFCLILSVLLIITHRSNIKRIIRKEESTIN